MLAVENLIEVIPQEPSSLVEVVGDVSDLVEILDVDPDTLFVFENVVLEVIEIPTEGILELRDSTSPDILEVVDDVIEILSEISPTIIGGSWVAGDGLYFDGNTLHLGPPDEVKSLLGLVPATDEFDVILVNEDTFILTEVPLIASQTVFLNGQRLREGVGQDYTIIGDTITFLRPTRVGDLVSAGYTHF